MKNTLLDRSWLTPLTAATFLACSGTGMLMFFHVRSSSLHSVHEWIGMLFVISGILHIICNWNVLKVRLSNKRVITPIIIVSGLTILLLAVNDGSRLQEDRGRAAYHSESRETYYGDKYPQHRRGRHFRDRRGRQD